jgi:TRAP-type mannitol/chloroaromatic compound transport system permease large subunit
MDIGTISLVLLLGLMLLLAIGMPLGMASAILAVIVLVLKFEPMLLLDPTTFGDGLLTRKFGTGPLNILAQKIYGLLTDYVLISVPLFIFMAALLERSGIAKDMYASLNVWLSSVRGGIAIVTSIMAVIMAAMSGIIGGEVVLLGLIALPQMLKLGYNQNLAIGTICASGSLGTMIPPSIVLIIFGLITETSIKALFTAAFLPGFMLACFFIVYIIIRTQLNPDQAPLPEPEPGDPQGVEKWKLFGAFMSIIVGGFSAALLLRVLFFTVTGQNIFEEGVDDIAYGTAGYIPWFSAYTAISLALILFAFGVERAKIGWEMGKGLVAPIVVIGVVLGSIYGGISGITEAAGMGVVAVLIISVFRGEASFDLVWESLMRTLKSTGTIIWVTIGAAALPVLTLLLVVLSMLQI